MTNAVQPNDNNDFVDMELDLPPDMVIRLIHGFITTHLAPIMHPASLSLLPPINQLTPDNLGDTLIAVIRNDALMHLILDATADIQSDPVAA